MDTDKTAIIDLADAALVPLEALLHRARHSVFEMARVDGGLDSDALDREQHATHGIAWLATYVEALRQLAVWARKLDERAAFTRIETLILRIAFGEYTNQILGGIPMSQGEIVRLTDLGLDERTITQTLDEAVLTMAREGNSRGARAELVSLLCAREGNDTFGDMGLDETMEQFRGEMRRFAATDILPHAHQWHLQNAYIPDEIISRMAHMGVFGLTIPQEFGGLGLGKISMCVVSEELSRAYIGVGSLGTRSEIAAELILAGGTRAQQEHWLPAIAAGTVLPTAVFTEPGTGSDLASLQTRAVREADVYRVSGAKTWITHPVRADLMTLLVRTDPHEPGYRGLSMLLAPKPRGTDDMPFPAPGMSGSEIEVLGYRGMKEYEISFDDFTVPAENLLGACEGQGFKQLMQTFESARIQTAARAIGVAQSALDLALRYAQERIQFGKPIITFARVANKIAMMAVEIALARQLTYFAARQKDQDKRCDLEAGMAKLLAARIAWGAADNAVQIHGGNGFALESPVSRILCDARILNIFEGAAEIQAQVIARRILGGQN